MDLQKIGQFIAKKRREQHYTQESLAEELTVSSRAVSKWERGICLPDAKNLAKLCQIFQISYNELLSGRDLDEKNYTKVAERNLQELSALESLQNRRLLLCETVIGLISTVAYTALIIVASMLEMLTIWRVLLLVLAFVILIVGVSFCLKLETEVGKYHCKKCGNDYVPKYSAVYFAPHFGRTRYMTCPRCHQKSWQRKKI